MFKYSTGAHVLCCKTVLTGVADSRGVGLVGLVAGREVQAGMVKARKIFLSFIPAYFAAVRL